MALVLALLMVAIAIHPAIDLVLATAPVALAIVAVFFVFAMQESLGRSKTISKSLAPQMDHSADDIPEDLIATICAMRC